MGELWSLEASREERPITIVMDDWIGDKLEKRNRILTILNRSHHNVLTHAFKETSKLAVCSIKIAHVFAVLWFILVKFWVHSGFMASICLCSSGLLPWHRGNRAISQVMQCIRQNIQNVPVCNRNVHTCAHFCYKMMHCGICMTTQTHQITNLVNISWHVL